MRNFIFLLFILIGVSAYAKTNIEETKKAIVAKYDAIEIKDEEEARIDEIKALYNQSREINFDQGIIRGLIILQRTALVQNDYILAGNYGSEAEKVAIKINDYGALSGIYVIKGQINSILDKYPEAKADLETSLSFSDKITNLADRYIQQSTIYANLAGMSEGENKDGAIYSYLQKAYEVIEKVPTQNLTEIQKSNYYNLYATALMNLGSYNGYLEKPDLKTAELYFNKMLEFQKENPKYTQSLEIDIYDKLSRFYFKKEEYEKVVDYSQKLLEAERSKNSPRNRLFAYQHLKDAYGLLKNSSEENKYLRLYTTLNDSIKRVEKEAIVQQSRAQVAKVNKEADYERNRNVIISTAVILVLLVVLIGYVNLKNRRTKKKYNELTSKIKINAKEEKQPVAESKQINIADDTLSSLLNKLEKFENSNRFIKKEVNFAYLVNYLGTNSKYLNEILKQYKDKSFSQYINDLRIDYIMKLLYEDPKYRAYKISYLAEVCGFASREVFTITFKKKTGISPSCFIENLQKENNSPSEDSEKTV